MISIALCDDEVKYLDYYETMIKAISKKYQIDCETIRFRNGESLLFYLEDHPNKFQIIFLDIITGGITGIETALKIRTFNEFAKIIFLTSSKDYVYNSFEASPSDYLIKELHDDKFEKTFLNTISKINKNLNVDVIHFKSNHEDVIIPINKITYIESFKRLVIVNLFNDKKSEFYYKLSDLTNELSNKNFLLIHRSFLVNLQYIHKISTKEIVLKDNTVLPVSRNLYQSVKEKYINYLNGQL